MDSHSGRENTNFVFFKNATHLAIYGIFLQKENVSATGMTITLNVETSAFPRTCRFS